MSSPVAETLVSLKRGLAGVGRGWYLFGAQAARVYGSCPLCSDIDATLVGSALQPSALLSRLDRAGFELAPDVTLDEVEEAAVLPVVHRAHFIAVAIVLGGPGLEQLFLDNAVTRQFGAVGVRVAAPEHLVLMTLLAGRDEDLEAAEAVTRAAPVDLQRLERLVAHIAHALDDEGITDNLARLRSRVGIGSGSV